MEYETEKLKENCLLIRPIDENSIEISNSSEFKAEVRARIPRSTEWLVLDLINIQYVDSSGIGALVVIMQHMFSNMGDIILLNLNHQIAQVLELTRLDTMFLMYDSMERVTEQLMKAPRRDYRINASNQK